MNKHKQEQEGHLKDLVDFKEGFRGLKVFKDKVANKLGLVIYLKSLRNFSEEGLKEEEEKLNNKQQREKML